MSSENFDSFFDSFDDIPNHQNCPCNNNWNEPIFTPLSFEDLNLNELLLQSFDSLKKKLKVEENYYTDMNRIFLHTFLDSSFIPE